MAERVVVDVKTRWGVSAAAGAQRITEMLFADGRVEIDGSWNADTVPCSEAEWERRAEKDRLEVADRRASLLAAMEENRAALNAALEQG